MNRAEMYKKILEMVKAGFRQGASKCGRKTDDVERNKFLREMRIFKDALEKFSPADRKLWQEQVEEFNEDLIALSKRESTAARAASWRKTCAGRMPNRQIQQAAEKRKRLDAIRKIVNELTANFDRATAKVVNKKLRESYKHLAPVETETVRKELSSVKAARQSDGK
jgi:hypothetical protein